MVVKTTSPCCGDLGSILPRTQIVLSLIGTKLAFESDGAGGPGGYVQIPLVDLLAGCCGWVLNEDGVCIEVCWRWLFEEGPGCGHLEQKPDGQGASMEAGWATSHG